ncbi:MAG: hypothetical protein DSY90_05790 [Deltaproteobacteria bacterium]|nr:MAG: hypothetical protein DSY90_05790 [Deltaproteobacteria bacterium]RTZ98566.1 MAG: hypothetical protein DSY89_09425 [Deltaproteobacteria bacterium]
MPFSTFWQRYARRMKL